MLNKLREITSVEDGYHPVDPQRMKMEGADQSVAREACLRTMTKAATTTSCETPFWFRPYILVTAFLYRLFQPTGAFSRHMLQYSDYRKFDDALRMVLDCTPEHVELLRSYLETCRDDLYYGMHLSDSSLMTCLASGIHFIDGNHGGYALAAKQMKEQMKAGEGNDSFDGDYTTN